MRLVDLNPRWGCDPDILIGDVVVHDENRVGMGITFHCPCCIGTPRQTRLAVFFRNPVDGKLPSDDYDTAHLWERIGDSFESLTLSPSIDASVHGHWHGSIVNGQIV